MLKVNATSPSAPNARCHDLREKCSHRTKAPRTPLSRNEAPKVSQSIATVCNMLDLRVAGTMVIARQHAQRITSAPPRLEPQLQSYQWYTRATRVPADIRHNPIACQAHTQPVLRATAITGSRYWQESLGGSALCLLHDDGRVACRVSPRKDDALVVLEDDVVIQLTHKGPKAYYQAEGRALLEKAGERAVINGKEVDPFYLAASLAAQLQLPAVQDRSIETCRAAIFRHVEALETSVEEWTDNGGRKDLEVLKTWMMDAVPTVV